MKNNPTTGDLEYPRRSLPQLRRGYRVMTVDGSFTGVVDNTTAVPLLEADGDIVEQLAVDVETPPKEGRHGGALFDCRVSDDALVDLGYVPERERARRERLQKAFDRLPKRLSER